MSLRPDKTADLETAPKRRECIFNVASWGEIEKSHLLPGSPLRMSGKKIGEIIEVTLDEMRCRIDDDTIWSSIVGGGFRPFCLTGEPFAQEETEPDDTGEIARLGLELQLRSEEGRWAYVAGMEQALRLAHNASDLPSLIKSLQGAVKLAREIEGLESMILPREITLDPPEVLCLKVGGDGPGANVETVRKGVSDVASDIPPGTTLLGFPVYESESLDLPPGVPPVVFGSYKWTGKDTKAYQEGFEKGRTAEITVNGATSWRPLGLNPYNFDTPEYKLWNDGFRDGHQGEGSK